MVTSELLRCVVWRALIRWVCDRRVFPLGFMVRALHFWAINRKGNTRAVNYSTALELDRLIRGIYTLLSRPKGALANLVGGVLQSSGFFSGNFPQTIINVTEWDENKKKLLSTSSGIFCSLTKFNLVNLNSKKACRKKIYSLKRHPHNNKENRLFEMN